MYLLTQNTLKSATYGSEAANLSFMTAGNRVSVIFFSHKVRTRSLDQYEIIDPRSSDPATCLPYLFVAQRPINLDVIGANTQSGCL